MFELLPASPMNAVLPVEIHHAIPAVGTDGINSVDLGNDDHPPPRKSISGLNGVEMGNDDLPPKRLGIAGIDVLSSVDFGDVTFPPKK